MVCATHKLDGNEKCKQKFLIERDIEGAFLEIIRRLVEDFQTVKATLRENIITSLENTNSADLDMTLKAIEHNQEMMFELIRDKRAGQLTETEYK